MLNSYKCIQRFFGTFFIALFCFLIFNNNSLTVKALSISETDVTKNLANIDDGVKDWTVISSPERVGSNQIGSIPISDNVSLDYTFGSARNSSGNVVSGDKTVSTTNTALNSGYGAGYSYYSKINVFINYGGKYYSIVHQGKNSYISGNPERASDTSIDFSLPYGVSDSYNSSSVLLNLETKVLYVGTQNGRKVLKVGGYLNKQGVYAEVLLRPSTTGAPIVQRELYIYKPDKLKTTQFQTFFGEDTAMTSDSSIYDSVQNNTDFTNGDDVPLYAIGGGQGLYINSSLSGNGIRSTLFVTNNVADGFTDYMGLAFANPYRWYEKGKQPKSSGGGFISSPALKVGNTDSGDTAKVAGTPLLYGQISASSPIFPVVDDNGKQNSAYLLRWPAVNGMEVGDVKHYASTIGSTISPYAIPVVSKTYTNPNQTNGLNHVGDTLHFKLKVDNQGLNSNWSFNKLVDNLPAGLQLDPSSVKYSSTYFAGTTGSGDNQHDLMYNGPSGSFINDSTSQLNITPNTIIKDKGTYTVTFDATVTLDALSNLSNGALNNTATFTGNNKNTNGTNVDTDRNYTDSVKIPIAPSTYVPKFTKSLRNNTTDPNGTYSTAATGKEGDVIDYRIQLSNTGTDSLKSATFSDTLPDSLKLKDGTIKVTNNGVVTQTPSTLSFNLNAYSSPVTIDFQATVTGVTASTFSNIAILDNIKTSSGLTYNNYESNAAVLNITETAPTMSIDDFPSSIDFGSINSDGSEKMLPNIKTNGRLVVTHSSDNPFQVTVGYDNNGETALSTHDSNGAIVKKLVQTNDDALYFNQNRNNNEENWTPISAAGIPIKSSGFSGSVNGMDLTGLIDTGKWKLLIPSNTDAGRYDGTITWGIADSI